MNRFTISAALLCLAATALAAAPPKARTPSSPPVATVRAAQTQQLPTNAPSPGQSSNAARRPADDGGGDDPPGNDPPPGVVAGLVGPPPPPPITNPVIEGPPEPTEQGLSFFPMPFIATDVAMEVVVGKGLDAKLCLHNPRSGTEHQMEQKCIPIDRPMPAGMVPDYVDASKIDQDSDSDARSLWFHPVGDSDPSDTTANANAQIVAVRFIAALARASTAWSYYFDAHPDELAEAISSFRASVPGTASVRSDGCYMETGYCDPDDGTCPPEKEAAGLCVNVPGQRPPPYDSPPGGGEPPAGDTGGGGGGGDQPDPLGKWPKEGLLAQVVPIAPPCGTMGMGAVCGVTIWGQRAPKTPEKVVDPYDQPLRAKRFWTPQWVCDVHFFCNEGQYPESEGTPPKDNDRGKGSKTSGKTRDELDQVCTDIAIVEMALCRTIIYSGGGTKSEKARKMKICEQEVNDRQRACFKHADELTDKGKHPAP